MLVIETGIIHSSEQADVTHVSAVVLYLTVFVFFVYVLTCYCKERL